MSDFRFRTVVVGLDVVEGFLIGSAGYGAKATQADAVECSIFVLAVLVKDLIRVFHDHQLSNGLSATSELSIHSEATVRFPVTTVTIADNAIVCRGMPS
jgi:hypothetical protein